MSAIISGHCWCLYLEDGWDIEASFHCRHEKLFASCQRFELWQHPYLCFCLYPVCCITSDSFRIDGSILFCHRPVDEDVGCEIVNDIPRVTVNLGRERSWYHQRIRFRLELNRMTSCFELIFPLHLIYYQDLNLSNSKMRCEIFKSILQDIRYMFTPGWMDEWMNARISQVTTVFVCIYLC